MNRREVLTLDLKDDPRAVAAYRRHHRGVWPEVVTSLRRVGVRGLDIYLRGRRLVMVLETGPGFDRRRAMARHVRSHPRCAEWEALMKTLQRRLPGARRGEWWAPMERVFHLRARGGRTRHRQR
jgi:L-rhamnose mutarotase